MKGYISSVQMELYELIERISKILTPKTNSLFYYVIVTSDDNFGFIRTCYRKKTDRLENLSIPYIHKVVVGFQNKFIEDNDYYDEGNYTKIKMQIFYFTRDIDTNIHRSWACGYNHVYIFDLKNKTYTYKVVESKDILGERKQPMPKKKYNKLFES